MFFACAIVVRVGMFAEAVDLAIARHKGEVVVRSDHFDRTEGSSFHPIPEICEAVECILVSVARLASSDVLHDLSFVGEVDSQRASGFERER